MSDIDSIGSSLWSSPVSPPLNSQGSCSPEEKASLYPLENPVCTRVMLAYNWLSRQNMQWNRDMSEKRGIKRRLNMKSTNMKRLVVKFHWQKRVIGFHSLLHHFCSQVCQEMQQDMQDIWQAMQMKTWLDYKSHERMVKHSPSFLTYELSRETTPLMSEM